MIKPLRILKYLLKYILNSLKVHSLTCALLPGGPLNFLNFLSNKSNFFEDLEVILKMPKWKFLKELI